MALESMGLGDPNHSHCTGLRVAVDKPESHGSCCFLRSRPDLAHDREMGHSYLVPCFDNGPGQIWTESRLDEGRLGRNRCTGGADSFVLRPMYPENETGKEPLSRFTFGILVSGTD